MLKLKHLEGALRQEQVQERAQQKVVSQARGRVASEPSAAALARMLEWACRVHTDFFVQRYLMSCAEGREDGAEKALRHRELCAFYVAVVHGYADPDVACRERSAAYEAIHTATQQLTEYLDEVIGFPLRGRPDYSTLAPAFFKKFHALAMQALLGGDGVSPVASESGSSGFARRCALLETCLPQADSRADLQQLHDEMLAEIDRLRLRLEQASAAFEREQDRADAAEVLAETAQSAERDRFAALLTEAREDAARQECSEAANWLADLSRKAAAGPGG
jgi:hypothetical protein